MTDKIVEDVDIKGEFCGIKFKNRDDGTNHILFDLCATGGELWFKELGDISTAWIDELINVLQTAKETLVKREDVVVNEFEGGFDFK